jgi:hypothetical protein
LEVSNSLDSVFVEEETSGGESMDLEEGSDIENEVI